MALSCFKLFFKFLNKKKVKEKKELLEIEKLKNTIISSERTRRISTIAIIMLLVTSTMLTVMPLALAYTAVPDRDTGTVVGTTPKLIGLGQQVIITIMTYPAPAGPTYYAQDVTAGLVGGLNNTSVSITKPDGTTDSFMPIDATLEHAGISIPGQQEIVGSLMFYYKPTQSRKL